MLKKVLSDLPAAETEEGLAPDSESWWVTILAEQLAKQPSKPKVSETLSRHSAAASCLKKVALLRDGVEPEPMDLAGHSITHQGTMIHEAWQAAIAASGTMAEFEVGTTIEDLTSGSCDVWLPAQRHVLELKTVGGFAYKMAVGERGPAEGPKTGHMVQLALNMQGLDATHGTLVYIAREAISAGAAKKKNLPEALRIGAQWTFTRARLQPFADEWLEQLRWVRDHETSEVPRFVPHEMPKGARLDPSRGAWTLEKDGDILDTGSYWSGGAGCKDYCSVATECVKRFSEGD